MVRQEEVGDDQFDCEKLENKDVEHEEFVSEKDWR